MRVIRKPAKLASVRRAIASGWEEKLADLTYSEALKTVREQMDCHTVSKKVVGLFDGSVSYESEIRISIPIFGCVTRHIVWTGPKENVVSE